jgi:hypothetical protein
MTKATTTALAAAAVLIMSAPAGQSLPYANGSFGFVPFGTVVSDTGNITAMTHTITFPPDVVVNTVSTMFDGKPNNLPIAVGDAVTLSNPAFLFPAGLGSASTLFNVSVHGITFTFDWSKTLTRIPTGIHSAGLISIQDEGILSFGAGLFEEGTPARLAMNCNQSDLTGSINCSDTETVTAGVINEPGSIGLLGVALVSAGLLARRRRQGR